METVGEYLKKERIKQGVSLENISSITKIGVDTLEKIELNDFSHLPAKPYIKGFLTAVSKVLGLEKDEVMKIYNVQIGEIYLNVSELKTKSVKKDPYSKKKNLHSDIMANVNETSQIYVESVDKDIPESRDEKLGRLELPVNLSQLKHKKILIAFTGVLAVLIILFTLFYSKDGHEKNKSQASVSNIETAEPISQKESNEIAKKEELVASVKEDIAKDKKQQEVTKIEKEEKNIIDPAGGFSILKVFSKGRSWVKYRIDTDDVKSITFIVGMARSFKIYQSIDLYIENLENIDIYFNDEKIDLTKYRNDNLIALKHLPENKKVKALVVPSTPKVEKEKIKIDQDLISPPKLKPEKLTF